jgi:hypothetical protein
MSFSARPILRPRDSAAADGGVWSIARNGGEAFRWEGFYTGPLALERDDLAAASRTLLGLELDDVPAAAARTVRPYVGEAGGVRAVVMHSATPGLRSLEADLADAESRRTPDDVATYVEARAVSLARPGDIVVGRTEPWRLAAELAGVQAVTIPGTEHYYLSHAIIALAVKRGEQAPALASLASTLRDRPDTLVRLYALDLEMQLVLLLLARLAGLEWIYTDANSPAIAADWNAKAPLHPSVDDASTMSSAGRGPHAWLAAESELSPLARRLAVHVTTLPGYSIDAGPVDEQVFARKLETAAHLLRERYGLHRGCLKPSQAGAGARIVSGIALDDDGMLRHLAARAWPSREAYVLEAQVEYLHRRVAGADLTLSPSGHIRDGRVAEGLTLQIMNGASWQGNIYVDEHSSPSVGLSVESYRSIGDAITNLHAGFSDRGLGLATAGFDFAVGQVGGAFADEVLVALQDPNMSSHGAEYLRHFLDGVRRAGGPRYGATKVVCPAPGMTLAVLRALYEKSQPEECPQVLASIPGRWGMIAVAAGSPVAATRALVRRERDLFERDAIIRVAPR